MSEAPQRMPSMQMELTRLITGASLASLSSRTAWPFCEGSPLERQALNRMKRGLPYDDSDAAPLSPGARATALALEILKNEPRAASWRCAVDTGECSFFWSAASGYTASGRAVSNARLLSSLCARHKTRLMLGSRVAGTLEDLPAQKLGALVNQHTGEREEFYGVKSAD